MVKVFSKLPSLQLNAHALRVLEIYLRGNVRLVRYNMTMREREKKQQLGHCLSSSLTVDVLGSLTLPK